MNAKEPETWTEAAKTCKAILQKFVPEHERIELMIHFYVFTPRYGDPLIVETPAEALKEAIGQDRAEETLESMERE
jgi:hypothetical protein